MKRAALLAAGLVMAGCAAGGQGSGQFAVENQTYGRRLLVRRCQNCHAIPAPSAMTAEKWSRGLRRMKNRMHLPGSDWDTLAAMSAAPPALETPAAASPEAPGDSSRPR